MNAGTPYRQRDVVLLPFPYSDLTGAKQRPALIISNNRMPGNDKLCCLITSAGPDDGVLIDSFASGKLPYKSWVKPHRLFTIDSRIIRKRMCTVTERFHGKIKEKIYGVIE